MVRLIDRADADRPHGAPVGSRRARAGGCRRSAPTPWARSGSRCRGDSAPLPRPRAPQTDARVPVYCRFCFRREVVGPGGPQALSGKALEAALDYDIAATPAIWEVILTGGDPFMLRAASPRWDAAPRRPSATSEVLRWRAFRWSIRTSATSWSRSVGSFNRKKVRFLRARQPRPRADRRSGGRVRPTCRRRHPHAEPDRAAEGRQR